MRLAILSPGTYTRAALVRVLRRLSVFHEVDLVIGLGQSEEGMMDALASPWEGLYDELTVERPENILEELLQETAGAKLLAPPWPLRLRPCSSGYPITLGAFTICFDDHRIGETNMIIINTGGERIRFRSAPPAFSFPIDGPLTYALFEVREGDLHVECLNIGGEHQGGPWLVQDAVKSST